MLLAWWIVSHTSWVEIEETTPATGAAARPFYSLGKIAAAYTEQDQKPLYDQMNELLFSTAPSVPTYWLVNPVAYTKRLTGQVIDINGGVRLNAASFS